MFAMSPNSKEAKMKSGVEVPDLFQTWVIEENNKLRCRCTVWEQMILTSSLLKQNWVGTVHNLLEKDPEPKESQR